ncbi:MAG: 5-formyltetrahydrofolate cyclo-ligase [Oscillospiraceae bacterium]|nr:5-formyltetrahydrofolate cyclo-ligase [Oscillospiraceae bacterium]
MHELKSALRRELIDRRKAMDVNVKSAWDSDIFEQLKSFLDNAGSVFTYVSTEIEVDTRRLIAYCLERGIPVAAPVSGDTELTFYYISRLEDLITGRFGILEPKRERIGIADERTLCVVPALCADGDGFRLGYGRGYYDRFLSDFRGTSIILCYESFRQGVPCESHDIKAGLTLFNRNPI